ncbi:MAG: hypothetical protein Q8936_20525 [Bacillota bacterium]|nr:hypothetical protein [Bacillota bacterium]
MNNSIEQLTEELIKINVGKIVYNKGIKDMLSFIMSYTKKAINKVLIKSNTYTE